MQKRPNFIANALELRLFCTKKHRYDLFEDASKAGTIMQTPVKY